MARPPRRTPSWPSQDKQEWKIAGSGPGTMAAPHSSNRMCVLLSTCLPGVVRIPVDAGLPRFCSRNPDEEARQRKTMPRRTELAQRLLALLRRANLLRPGERLGVCCLRRRGFRRFAASSPRTAGGVGLRAVRGALQSQAARPGFGGRREICCRDLQRGTAWSFLWPERTSPQGPNASAAIWKT